MRRIAPLILIVLVTTGFAFRDRWLVPRPERTIYLGYVEGETTLISAPVAGRIVARSPQRGDQLRLGAVVFAIDPTTADAEVARAAANVAETVAQLENLRTGKRDLEQAVVRAQRRETMAALRLAEQELARATQLSSSGAASRMRLDQATSQVEQLKAKVEQFQAQEAAGDLGGRSRELEAAEAKVTEVKASLLQAQSRKADLAPVALFDALVENTFFDVGEWVGAGQPVVSLLAPDKLKLRFFVPETHVVEARIGATVAFTCDGCATGQKATITFVAPRAEFTPPVIYSESARRKLVFLVEAKPVAQNGELRVGLPVEVETLTKGAP
jgi:HlyD family secretion protein